jgi:hypothetical protein
MNAFGHKNHFHIHNILSEFEHTLHNKRFWAITGAIIATIVLLTLLALLAPGNSGFERMYPSNGMPYYPMGY